MLQRIRLMLEMIRFSHTLFALPFALLAIVMIAGIKNVQNRGELFMCFDHPDVSTGWPWTQVYKAVDLQQVGIDLERRCDLSGKATLGIVLCMVFARSTAMAFNRLVDRKLDAKNPRTAMRHLPAGLLSVPAVTTFAIVSAALFVTSTLLFLPNRLPLYLSLPVLAFLCSYSYAKRFTALAHFWLGTALSLAPIAVWIALRGTVEWPPVVLAGAVALWVAGFDIIYACQDYEFDKQAGLHSVPARLGVKNALRVAAACHAGMVILLALMPVVFPLFGMLFWLAVGAVAVLLIYEHGLVRPDDLSRVNVAFFNVNAVIGLGLLAVGAADLWF